MRPLAKKAPKPRATLPTANLNAALARLRTPADVLQSERSLQHLTVPERLEAILCEIDETVLPRQITLHVDGTIVARMAAANRRLCTIDLVLQSTDLPEDGTATPFAFAKGLSAASEYASSISTAPIKGAPSADKETHCSVSQLRKALLRVAAPPSIDDLQSHLFADAVAHLKWQCGTATRFDGDTAWQDFLKHQVEHFGRAVTSQRDDTTAKTSIPSGCAIPLSAKQVLVIHHATENGFAVVTDLEKGLLTIQKWQARELSPV